MEVTDRWDNISEHEIDNSWRDHQTPEYIEYRRNFELAQKREYLSEFPLSVEIESSYHCNLECPMCPRVVNIGERNSEHMSQELWQMILSECKQHRLPSMLMDHEAESLMNPRFFDMVEAAKYAGVFDVWLHTNANMLTPKRSARLISSGLTKINFSIDATTTETYDIVRPGGDFKRVVENVKAFLNTKLDMNAHYLRTRVSFVEMDINLAEKEDFFRFWSEQPGLNLITFQECIDFSPFETPDADIVLSEAALQEKYSDSEPFHCSLPWEMPVIDVKGNVIPCGSPVREHTSDFILGNILAGDTIASCWKSEQMSELRSLHERGEWYKNPMCRVCVNTLRGSRRTLVQARESKDPAEATVTISLPG